MLQIRRILFPTDYSECAGKAFAHATYLAKRFQAELHILNVSVEQQPIQIGLASELVMPIEVETPPAAPPLEYNVPDDVSSTIMEIKATSPEAGILAYEKEFDPDLIVIGTHGRTGIDRLVMGSVAEDIVRRAHAPVLTVHPSAVECPANSFQRILVPVDFSEFTGLSLAYAVELARIYQSELVLIHIIEETLVPHVYGIEPVTLTVPAIEDRSRDWMEELVHMVHLSAPNVAVQTQVTTGYAAQDIARFAGQTGCELVVIATHGRTGVRRLLLGSVTEKVVRHAPCPVFTVKSFGKTLVPPLVHDSLHEPA